MPQRKAKLNAKAIGILGFIASLRAVSPLCILYTGTYFLRHKGSYSLTLFRVYALLESLFYFLVYLPRKRLLQRQPEPPKPLTRQERRDLFIKSQEHKPDDDYPTGWFFDEDVKLQNVREWTYWALFLKDTKEANPELTEEVDEYISIGLKSFPRHVEEGYNPKAKAMRPTFDKVESVHRPLIWYAMVAGIDAFAAWKMHKLGFKHHSSLGAFNIFPPRLWTVTSSSSPAPRLSYWVRPHRSTTKLPILFLHGIGVGLAQYTGFIEYMMRQDRDVGIIVIEALAISSRMTLPPPPSSQTVDSVTKILDSLSIDRVVVVSHSFGTVSAAHLLRSEKFKSRVAGSVLIDPIPFFLHTHYIVKNLIYKEPELLNVNDWVFYFFAARDGDTSRAIGRHVFWTETVLWKEDIKDMNVGVVLSGGDSIIEPDHIRAYLTGESEASPKWSKDGLEVLWFPRISHGGVFNRKDRMDKVLDIVHRFISIS